MLANFLPCCTKRDKQDQSELQTLHQTNFMLHRYIFSQCSKDESFDHSFDQMNANYFHSYQSMGSLKENKQYTKIEWLKLIHTQKVCDKIKNTDFLYNLLIGVPEQIKPAAWMWLVDVESTYVQSHSTQLYEKLIQLPCRFNDQIKLEVPESSKNHSGVVKNILIAYFNYDTESTFSRDIKILVQSVWKVFNPSQYVNINQAYGKTNFQTDELYFQRIAFWVVLHIMYTTDLRKRNKLFNKIIALNFHHNFQKTLNKQMNNYFQSSRYQQYIQHLKKLQSMNIQLDNVFGKPLLFKFLEYKFFNSNLIEVFMIVKQGCILEILLEVFKINQHILQYIENKRDMEAYLKETFFSHTQEKLKKLKIHNLKSFLEKEV